MSLNLADRSATLLALYGLHGPGADALADALAALPQEDLPDGAVVCAEGETPAQMWVLLDGAVQVTKKSYTGQPLRLADLEAPALLGHMGMIDGAPRSATCTVRDGSRVAVLDRAAFDRLLEQPGLAGDAFRRLLIASMNRQLDRGNHELRALLEAPPEAALHAELAAAEARYAGWTR